jgi:hypothetical protein
MIEPRDEELSRIYRDAQAPVPPQRVDDNILAASRRVAGVGPRSARSGFARRWGTPVALAATVVVTFTLTLVAFEQRTGMDTAMSEAPVANRASNVLSVEPKLADRLESLSPAELQPAAPTPTRPAVAARRDRSEQRATGNAAPSVPLGTGRPDFVPEVPRTSEVLRKREEAKPAAAAAPATNLQSNEGSAVAQPAPLPEAPRSAETLRQMQRAPAAAAGSLRDSASTPQAADAVSGVASRLAAPEVKERTPEKWLEDIRRLKTEGKTAELERELNEFKKRYPDYRLPEDLR